MNRLHNADIPSNFGLLSEACDKARKTGRVIWATVSHCPGKLFKVFPGDRIIAYDVTTRQHTNVESGLISMESTIERDPLTEDATNDPDHDPSAATK